jgi:hypothetical protein
MMGYRWSEIIMIIAKTTRIDTKTTRVNKELDETSTMRQEVKA